MLPKKMKINILQKHIDSGRRRWSTLCPLAKAVRAKYPNYHVSVVIDRETEKWGKVLLFDEKTFKMYRYPLPANVNQKLREYDDGGEFALKNVILELE